MIVAFDASVLIYLLNPAANAPIDPKSNRPVERCADRVTYLVETLQREKAVIIVPTPSLAEILVRAGEEAPAQVALLERSKHFRIVGFDKRAAVEHAARQAERKLTGKKYSSSRPKAKFDDQIVAIAAVSGAIIIYSDDPDIKTISGAQFEVVGIADLPLPPEEGQGVFPFEDKDDDPTVEGLSENFDVDNPW